jgi:hypothetical protein
MEISLLLEQAGNHPRGNRHDCSKCGGRRTITHTAEVFYCHKCTWTGNTITLAGELGLTREWLPRNEYIRRRQQRERADRLAHVFYNQARQQCFALLDELHAVNRLEGQAHQAGPDHPATWGALALVYSETAKIEAELDFLENASARDLLSRFCNR